jgi:hypothetical protein
MLKYWGTGYDMCGVWVDDQYKKWVENNKDWTLHMFGHKGTFCSLLLQWGVSRALTKGPFITTFFNSNPSWKLKCPPNLSKDNSIYPTHTLWCLCHTILMSSSYESSVASTYLHYHSLTIIYKYTLLPLSLDCPLFVFANT